MVEKNIWVISDPHFNHEKIIGFCGRPFENAKQMNEALVSNWNEVVKPWDKVYCLGDVYMGGGIPREETFDLLRSLNGHKRLILGNHDNGKDQVLQKSFEKIDMWRMFPEFGLLLTHVPVHESTLGEGRFMEKKFLNVHGHIHQNESPSQHHQCVCVEHTHYRPVNIEDLRII